MRQFADRVDEPRLGGTNRPARVLKTAAETLLAMACVISCRDGQQGVPARPEDSAAQVEPTKSGDADPTASPDAGPPPTGAPCPSGMVLVEGGRVSDEQSQRWKKLYPEVSAPPAEIAAFCLALHEATEADLRAREPEIWNSWTGTRPPCIARGECGTNPLVNIGGQNAEMFCTSGGTRLPTLFEWLWAAGGGADDRVYPWGSEPPSVTRLNGCDLACGRDMRGDCDDREIRRGECEPAKLAELKGDDGFGSTAPVGSFPAGAGRWAHLDLAGNVSEYTSAQGRRFLCGTDFGGSHNDVGMSLHALACDGKGGGTAFFAGVRCASDPAPTRRR